MPQSAAYSAKDIDFDLENVFEDFKWHVDDGAADLEKKLLSELHALEAANLHAIITTKDTADSVVLKIDAAIHELDTIDQWLTHYTEVLDVRV
jgi:hypothetical protein